MQPCHGTTASCQPHHVLMGLDHVMFFIVTSHMYAKYNRLARHAWQMKCCLLCLIFEGHIAMCTVRAGSVYCTLFTILFIYFITRGCF